MFTFSNSTAELSFKKGKDIFIMELKRLMRLFAVEPLLIIYAFQYNLTWTVTKLVPS